MGQDGADQDARRSERGIPVGLLAVLIIALLALPGLIAGHLVRDEPNVFHWILTLFCATNLLICYWEMCLFTKRDYIRARSDYWRAAGRETGRSPAVAFLTDKAPLRRCLSPTLWADVWAAYSSFDSAYTDRNSYGFNVDIANGFVTFVPTAILYAVCSVGELPAVAAGVFGAMFCWQWFYMTSVYLLSFFVGGKQKLIGRRELRVYILGPNIVWVIVPAVALYVSIRLIVDGDYAVLGLG